MKALSKDAKGLIKFIFIFLIILLSGLIAYYLNYTIPYYLAVNDSIDRVVDLFLTFGMFIGYAILQLVMVYVLAKKMLSNTENKYLKKIFTPFDNSVKILLTLFIFDAAINLFLHNNFDLSTYDNSDLKHYLFIYDLYLAPSVKFLVIFLLGAVKRRCRSCSTQALSASGASRFLLACLNKLKPAPPKEE